ncbi:MAG: hypothetical protein KAU94_05365 [Verrucomicrobia bacterium]|nr:hypothetical protein [Verrucomicrobiota bacterium]
MKNRNEQTQQVDRMIQNPFKENNNAETTARLEQHMDAFRADLNSHPYVKKLERRQARVAKAPHQISFPMKLAVSTASILVIGALLLFGVFAPGTAFAFEDVVEQLMKFRPYRCHITTYREGARMRIREVYYRDNYCRRDESTNLISGRKVISIYDRQSTPWKVLHIIPDNEFATESQIEGVAPAKDPDSDILYIIQQLQGKAADDLGWDTIEGVEAKGFSGVIDGITWKVWANPKTGLPVKVEKITNESGIVMKMSRFEFDVIFEVALFNTVAPEGYRVQKLAQEKGSTSNLPKFVPHAYTQTFELGGKVQSKDRIEHLTQSIRRQISPDGRIDVIDMSKNNLHQITLYPDRKVAVKQTTNGFGSRKDPYCLNLLEKTRTDKHRLDLGEKLVDGTLAYGLRSESPANAFEFWVDRETGLPVRMVIHHLSSKVSRYIICSDFDFETPLDASLFSTEAPKEYEIRSAVEAMGNHDLPKQEFIPHSYRSQLELHGEIKMDQRIEHLPPSIRRQIYLDGRIDVIDLSAVDSKILIVVPSKMVAEKQRIKGHGIREHPYCLDIMQQAAAQASREYLGEKMVEERLAYGFKTDLYEVWVDKETELPLRMIWPNIIMSEFDFTTPVDEALFSTEPPEGYSLEVR